MCPALTKHAVILLAFTLQGFQHFTVVNIQTEMISYSVHKLTKFLMQTVNTAM